MPKGKLTYRRGEIWWVNLNPIVGSETGKERPCLILQNDVGNKSATTTIVAPLLPGHKNYPFVVNISPTTQNGLRGERYVNLSQLRAVDALRIKNKQGVLEDSYWASIERAIAVELGFEQTFNHRF